MAEAGVFEASWLYFQTPSGELRSAVVQSQEEYEALLKAGWATSPAAFGIETHPSMPVMTIPDTAMVAPAGAHAVPSDEFREVLKLLTSFLAQQEAAEGVMNALEARVAALEEAATETSSRRRSN